MTDLRGKRFRIRWRRRDRLFPATEAVDELLGDGKGRVVQFLGALHQSESRTELVVKGFGVVTRHVEPAASDRTFRAKGGHDCMASALYRLGYRAHICGAVLRGSEEVEDGAIMPNVVRIPRQINAGDIGSDPTNELSFFFQPLFCNLDGSLGDVEESEVLIAAPQKVIHQRGLAAADIDNSSKVPAGSALNQRQRKFQMRAVPTDAVGRGGGVNPIPMLFPVGSKHKGIRTPRRRGKSWCRRKESNLHGLAAS